jgi:DNA-directed RNA polymerase specialized sigma24 family protein
MDLLPPLHTAALRLRDAGADAAAIADELGLGLDEVEPLLRVASAKLARLMADGHDASEVGP